MTLVAVVPVRRGSKGLPGKNLKPLAGTALWQHAVNQGLQAGADRVIVTTDIPDLLTLEMERVTMLARPAALSGDSTAMAPVLMHALVDIEPGAEIVLLQATSPMRSEADIRNTVQLYRKGGFDLVKTVSPTDSGILKFGTLQDGRFKPVSDPAYCFANRQSLPQVMKPNGAVYVFGRDWFLGNGGFVTEKIGAVVMPEDRSFDIDSDADFQRAEAAFNKG